MAVTDYSTTPGSNTAISGINIAENCSPANINNSIRQLMADIATALDDGTFLGGASFQPLDASLTALAALVTAANKGVYFTAADTPATFDLTAFARTLLDDANAAAARATLGVAAEPATSGTAASGKITLGNFTIAWNDVTATANTTTSVAYGGAHTYASWARAWFNGGSSDAGAQDNDPFVSSTGLSTANLFSARDTSVSGTIFSIGV
jgi:hypothetical protein